MNLKVTETVEGDWGENNMEKIINVKGKLVGFFLFIFFVGFEKTISCFIFIVFCKSVLNFIIKGEGNCFSKKISFQIECFR